MSEVLKVVPFVDKVLVDPHSVAPTTHVHYVTTNIRDVDEIYTA